MYNELLELIKGAPRKDFGYFDAAKYLGTPHLFYGLSSPTKKLIVKQWKTNYPAITYEELINIMDLLYKGKSFEEKTLPPVILDSYPKLKKQFDMNHYDNWLNYLQGWAEVDSSCQSMFDTNDLLNNWEKWKKLLTKFNNDVNISKRRASLVLLCKAVRTGIDPKLADIAFSNIKNLMTEKDILITKAISWLLRDLIKNYRQDVVTFLEMNQEHLPKIALRETTKKLATGKK